MTAYSNMPAGRELDAIVAEKVMDDPVERRTVDDCPTCGGRWYHFRWAWLWRRVRWARTKDFFDCRGV